MPAISWCTYPLFPIMGASAVVGIQLGYYVFEIISKRRVGFKTYQIIKATSVLKN